jgi:hypothetical protein
MVGELMDSRFDPMIFDSDTMIKHKNLYIKYVKSGTRRERERERERERKYVMDYIILRLNY